MIDVQTRPASFAQAVLLRPQMYTLDGTFSQALAFLEGYYSGMAKGNPYAAPVCEWESFRVWLAEQLCVVPEEAFAAFRRRNGDGQDAADKLAESLNGFLAR